MTDPDAWMQDISAIVRQKNQAKQDAATLKHDREQHLIAEYEKVRQLVKGQPTEAFEQFGSFLNSEGETAKISNDMDDKEGPWVGLGISDADGKFLDVRLQARVGADAPRWFWIYAYGDRNNRNAQEEEVPSSAAGPSKQYVIETLAGYYTTASAKHR
ncbi:MAG TPA: hypothetical protein VK356_13450 [Thermomicrobiales bacterium]|nr:hypothetical protein [Thermomicrobiales bacterium]